MRSLLASLCACVSARPHRITLGVKAEEREGYIFSMMTRAGNRSVTVSDFYCVLSCPSVDRFGKILGGLMTLGQVKCVLNFC